MPLRLAVLALALACGGPARAAAIDTFGWLAGCWAGERTGMGAGDAPRRFEEHWMAPRAGVMLGMSRTTRGETFADHEFMRIQQDGASLVFHAQPRGAAPTVFRAARIDGDGAVFENAAHDFPQRVIYRRAPDGSLAARIEGQMQGKPRSVDFPMQRIACPG